MDGNVTRRQFVKGAAVGAAGVALGANALQGAILRSEEKLKAPPPAKILNHNENMEYRRLGKTNAWVSAVCMGGHWKRVECMFPAKGEVNPYNGPKDEADMDPFMKNRAEVVAKCIDIGINYIDACTGSEVKTYAKALKGRRDKVYLGYSFCEYEMRQPSWQSEEKLLEGLNQGLQEAGIDHVDVWRITMHEEPRNQQRGTIHSQAHADATVGALTKAQKAGKARFIGFSCHDREWIKEFIEKYPEIQVICTPYTAGSKEKPKDSLFEAVRKCDVGVFGIKPFASNALFKGSSAPKDANAKDDDERARLAIRYILSNDAITAPIPGLINIHQVENMALAIQERRKMDQADARKFEEIQKDLWARIDPHHAWLKNWEYV